MKQTIYSLITCFLMSLATVLTAQPANDNCSGAQAISLPSSGSACVTGTTVGATATDWTSPGICGQTNWSNDVWYTFVSTGTYTVITVSPTGSPAATLLGASVYTNSANCNADSFVPAGVGSCYVTTTNAGIDTIYANGGPVGTVYYVEVNSFGTAGSFNICVSSTDPPPSPGSTCATATKLCSEASFALAQVPAGGSSFTPDCFNAGAPFDAVWYQFTVGVSGTLAWECTPTEVPTVPATYRANGILRTVGNGIELDWAMYDITNGCPTNANQTNEVTCNYDFSGENSNPVGMSTTSGTVCPLSTDPGSKLGEFCPSQTILAGHTYAIIINNFSYPLATGWNFNFTGSTFIMAPIDTFTLTPDTICGTTGTVTVNNLSVGDIWQQWNFGDGTTSLVASPPAHTYTSPGTYFVTLLDSSASGCIAVASKSVLITPYPTDTVKNDTICAGGTGTLTAIPSVPGGTFHWSTGATTASISASPATTTTYTVTYTSPTGCTVSDTAMIVVSTPASPVVNSPTICAGTSATLTTSGGGTYAWSPTTNMTPPAGNTASVTVTPTVNTTYTVTVTSPSGCSATASSMVTVNPLPSPTVNNATVCAGTSATLTTSGGGTYAWSPTTNMTPPAGNTASVTVTPTANTTYDVTVTSAAGCSATASGTVTINPNPVANAGGPFTVCAGSGVTIGGSPTASGGTGPYTYQWAPGTGLSSTTVPNPTTTVTTSTNYAVTVTDANGCSASATCQVTVNPLPVPTVNNATVCAGTSATLTTSGGGTYAWSPTINMTPPAGNTASVTVTPTTNTTYDVTVTTAAGCSASASGTVTVNPLPAPTVNSPAVCAGTSATLTTSGGGTYAWSPTTNMTPPAGNTASVTVTPTTNTTYDVTVTTAAGCSASASGTVTVNPLPVPVVSNDTVCTGTNATLTVTGFGCAGFGISYQWSSTQTTETITVSSNPNTYCVTVTTASGCSASACGSVVAKPLSYSTISQSICAGSSYTFGTQTLTTAGSYADTLPGASVTGCDSIVTLTLTLIQPTGSSYSESICSGDSYTFGGQTLNTSGTYADTLAGASVTGCDSIITLTLNVVSVIRISTAQAICPGSSYVFGANTLTTPGTYMDSATSVGGCDSITTLTLSFLPIATASISAAICPYGSYVFGNNTLTAAGTYIDTFPGVNGCDSITTLTLSIIPVTTTPVSKAICNGTSYTFGGQSLTSAGTYADTLTGVAGCDSIVVLTLSVLSPSFDTISETICSNSTYSFGGQTLDSAGTYTTVLTNIAGCDSTVTLLLSVVPVINTPLSDSVCAGDSVSFGGQWYSTSGAYSDTFISVNGCDSIVTMTLTLLPLPVAGFTIEPLGNSIPMGDITVTDQSTGADSILWLLNGTAINLQQGGLLPISSEGNYCIKLIAQNAIGCSSTSTECIYVYNGNWYMPNAFTPNGDGVNDYIGVYGSREGISYMRLTIFDRWGEKVFDSEDLNSQWDGKYKGVLQEPGVYVYMLTINFVNDTTIHNQGNITLIR